MTVTLTIRCDHCGESKRQTVYCTTQQDGETHVEVATPLGDWKIVEGHFFCPACADIEEQNDKV